MLQYATLLRGSVSTGDRHINVGFSFKHHYNKGLGYTISGVEPGRRASIITGVILKHWDISNGINLLTMLYGPGSDFPYKALCDFALRGRRAPGH